MRRGPGGGLVVAEPNRSGVAAAMIVWFSYVGVTIDEMLEARLVILEGACRLAAARADRRQRAKGALASLDLLAANGAPTTEQLAGVEGVIAGLAANPALSLFVEAVADLGMSRLRAGRVRMDPPVAPEEATGQLAGYRTVVESVAAGNGDQAASRMRQLVMPLRDRMVDARPTRSWVRANAAAANPGKMAEVVAGALRDYIEQVGWPVGKVLGSESDLIERLGVSRAILREAVRILEHHGAVVTKRGPKGGIIVCDPDSAAIVRSARLILEYEGVTPENLSLTRSVIEVAVARMAAERITPELAARLVAVLEREALSGDAAASFGTLHHAIAEGTGNRVLALFVDVMGELVPSHFKAERRTPEGQTELSVDVHRVHERLVRAIVAGDDEEAGNRMRRHMIASAEVVA